MNNSKEGPRVNVIFLQTTHPYPGIDVQQNSIVGGLQNKGNH